jgi:hypothetical protein
MPTKIYDSAIIKTIDNKEIEISPLKIRYLRKFMEQFDLVKTAKDDDETIALLVASATITMQQYYPSVKTVEDFEDNFDLKTVYKILDVAAGIKIEQAPEDIKNISNNPITNQAVSEASSWENLDLAKLEAEVFLLGIWKDYQQLETSLSMPELMATLEQKRESDYQEKKFLAAMQGVDLDESSGRKEEDPWEAMKARVAAQTSGIGNGDPNDITALQGIAAQQAGFGIGMGLDYEVVNG